MLLIVGSAILISSTVLLVRKRAFESKFKGISDKRERVRSERAFAFYMEAREGSPSSSEQVDSVPVDPENQHGVALTQQASKSPTVNISRRSTDNHIQWADDDDRPTARHSRTEYHHPHRVFPMVGVGARPDLNNHPRDVPPNLPLEPEDEISVLKGILRGTQKYFASKGLISRNSQFHGLSPAEREILGGVEYKAVSFLSIIVPVYYLMFLILGIIGVGGWLQANHPSIPRENGLSPFWTGAFFAVSAFVNSGMSLLDANMVALQKKYVCFFKLSLVTTLLIDHSAYPLLTMGMLILAGNTLYPCFLRFIIWAMRRLLPRKSSWDNWRITLDFILDHPRRVRPILLELCHC